MRARARKLKGTSCELRELGQVGAEEERGEVVVDEKEGGIYYFIC